MQISYEELSYDGKWYNFKTKEIIEAPGEDGVFLKIRPRPASKSNVIYRNGEMVLSGEDSKKDFTYCLESWKGVTGSDDKALPCTDEVKGVLFDLSEDPQVKELAGFVVGIGRGVYTTKGDLEKN